MMSNGASTGMTEKTSIVICDAGPIIHLDELACLDLMGDFEEILIPDTVWKEIEHHRPSALEKTGTSFRRCLPENRMSEPLSVVCQMFSLDAGEIEALAILERHPSVLFLTDDAAAR